jgi:hypothetical protein
MWMEKAIGYEQHLFLRSGSGSFVGFSLRTQQRSYLTAELLSYRSDITPFAYLSDLMPVIARSITPEQSTCQRFWTGGSRSAQPSRQDYSTLKDGGLSMHGHMVCLF